ncbi:MAG: tetratricopeptide repeat protein, partial [Pseudomonadota bacterium]
MFNPDQLEEQVQRMPMDRFMAEMQRLKAFVKKNPKNWETRYALALFHLRTQSTQDALVQLKKAHKLNPRSEIILKTISEVLFLGVKDYKNAFSYLKKWSAMRKDLAVLWIYLAHCEKEIGRPADALKSLDQAARIDPDQADLRLNRADVYTRIGNEEQAQSEYEAEFEKTGNLAAISGLVALPNYQPDLEKLREITTEIFNSEDANIDQTLLSGIGQVFEKLEAFDEAFDCFKRFNDQGVKHIKREEHLAPFKNVRET